MKTSVHSCTIVAFCLLLSGAGAHKVTPIQTVIELLESLTVKVTEDGKKDAATYDKFACFCKKQADDKLYAIEKSTKLISDLDATEVKLDGEVKELATQIGDHTASISSKEGTKSAEISSRAAEHKKYLEDKGNLANGIAAVENAIEVLAQAKGDLVNAKLTGALLQKVRPVLTQFAPGQLPLLAQLVKQPGNAARYQYQGNQLLQTLAGIVDLFKKHMKDMDIAEFGAKKVSDAKVLGLTNEIAFETKEKEQKEAIEASKQDELGATKEQKLAETEAKKADQDFLKVVEGECEEKAVQWDSRSLLRANELTALSKATEELKKGALDNFNANKKLVGLHQVVAKPSTKMVSFLQLRKRGLEGKGANIVVQKVQALLATAATRLSSSTLTSAALKILVSKDHFVKVRALIKDLVAKLEADARAEASTKEQCDSGMRINTMNRDTAIAQIETATANIDRLNSDNAELKSEISTLKKEIADLTKALAVRTAMRSEESDDNLVTSEMSDEGKAAVERAIQILTTFYEGAKAVLLQRNSYVPPNVDRSGNTIRDYEDEIFATKYQGAQTESHGIIGILQTILSDFDRTSDTTKSNELMSQKAFDTYKEETDGDIKAKEKDIETKEGKIADNDGDLVTEKSHLKIATDLKNDALKTLENLKIMCVDGEETYEQRVKKREEEIAALKEALDVLIAWQS